MEMLSVKNAIERVVNNLIAVHERSNGTAQTLGEDVQKTIAAFYVSGQITEHFKVEIVSNNLSIHFSTPQHHGLHLTIMLPSSFRAKNSDIHKLIKNRIDDDIDNLLMLQVGEWNDKHTRTNVCHSIAKYLRAHAIQDYVVTCDDSNNPPSVVDKNKLCVDIDYIMGDSPCRITTSIPKVDTTSDIPLNYDDVVNRKIFYVDTGDLPVDKAQQYITDTIEAYNHAKKYTKGD